MLGKKIVKTMIISDDSRKSAVSIITRGAVGSCFLGPVGLLAGASAKNKKTTTFLIEYSDGSRQTKTVKTNGADFKHYCKYIEM